MNYLKNIGRRILKEDNITTLAVLMIGIVFSILVFNFLKLENNGIFGGNGDWQYQDIVFIDFLRQNFWNTGELFPNFSLLLGSGINFADLSYYGVMRPEVLLSYLFPSISSYNWVIISYFLLYILSGVLCYRWLSNKSKNPKLSLIVTILYLSTTVLLKQSIISLMFANYFSWLFLLLIGVDKYQENNKNNKYKYLIILATTLLILSSYYFAVAGLIIVGLYVLLNSTWKSISIIYINILIGVFLSAFFLVPTIIETLLNSREQVGQTLNVIELIIPSLSFESILIYNNLDSTTLTIISVVAIIYNLLSKNKNIRNLAILVTCLISFPIVKYIFSGLDYVQDKNLIPLLPLLLLLILYFMNNINIKKLLISITVTLMVSLIYYQSNQYFVVMIVDIFIVLILGLISYITNKKVIYCYVLLPMVFLFTTLGNIVTEYGLPVGQKERIFSMETRDVIKEVLDNDNSLSNYRFESDIHNNVYYDERMHQANFYSSVINRNYVDFLYNEVNIPANIIPHNVHLHQDPFALYLMGVNKIVSDKDLSNLMNYSLYTSNNEVNVFENDVVLPISYVSYNNISSQEYNTLSQASKIDALVNYGIVEDNNTTYNAHMYQYSPNYQVISKSENVEFSFKDNGDVVVHAREDATVNIKLDKEITDQILMIDCQVKDIENQEENRVMISINGRGNVRTKDNDTYTNGDNTFAWHLASNNSFDDLEITFGEGTYTLTNIEINLMDKTNLNNRVNEISPLVVEEQQEKVLVGEVEWKEDGYLITSIPYQEGFKITVDGKEQQVERVNTNFIGAKISKGKHQVAITYQMPGRKIGNIMSITAVIIIFVLILRDVTNQRSKDKS